MNNMRPIHLYFFILISFFTGSCLIFSQRVLLLSLSQTPKFIFSEMSLYLLRQTQFYKKKTHCVMLFQSLKTIILHISSQQ